MPTATLTITTIPTQTAGVPFTVTGTYTLSTSTWTDELSYEDNQGAHIPFASPAVNIGISSITLDHAALPAGNHTITIKDPFTGATLTSNTFSVVVGHGIVANAPSGAVAGTPVLFTGTLVGYASNPTLSFSLNGAAPVTMPASSVTLTGWSISITVATAGASTLIVSDGSISSATVTFTVAPATVNHIITPAVPTGATVGSVISFTGSLTGYAAAPALTYVLDNAPQIAMTGVTATGWSMNITAPATAGTHVITVSDGTTTGLATFTVAAAPHVITPQAPSGVVVSTAFTFTGVLTGYSTIPALTYSISGATPVVMTGVSTTGWAMSITAPAVAGNYNIVVSDGTIPGNVTFTVAAASGPVVTPVTWNPNDLSTGITLSNGSYTATSGGSATPGSSAQSVRATTAINSSLIVMWEATVVSVTQNWTVGVANSTFALANVAELGSDVNGIGAYVSTGSGSQPAQTVYFNSAQLTAGNGVSSVAADVVTIVTNGTNFYFSDAAMRTTAGVTWNNSTTANPMTNVGGFPFTTVGTTFFPIFNEAESGGAAKLNDGTVAFSAFGAAFLAANPSVVTLSTQNPAPPAKQIIPNQPQNTVAGTPFAFSGTLIGYTLVPALTYSVNGGTQSALGGVTATGWNMTITIAATGSNTIVVTDGTVEGVTAFTTTTSGGPGGITITGVTISNATVTSNSPIGTVVGTLTGTSAGGALTGVTYTLATQSTSGAFKVVGTSLEFASATVAVGSYTVTISVAAGNASNTPQSYVLTIAVNALTSSNFSISGGNIIAPSGSVFIPRGVTISVDDLPIAITNSAAQPLTTLFAGLTAIRLSVGSTASSQATAYSNGSFTNISPYVNILTALGIVVTIEDHTDSTGLNTGGAQGVNYTGAALTAETNWYASLATGFLGNPRVWFGSKNEPPNTTNANGAITQGACTTQHVAIYNAIRATGNNNIIEMEQIGGDDPQTGSNNMGANNTIGLYPNSAYATMHNIIWGPHFYNWVTSYSTVQSVSAAELTTMIGLCQQIQSADGVVPVVVYEYAVSTSGTLDPGGFASAAAVQASGIGSLAWSYDQFQQANSLTNAPGANTLTTWGQQTANFISSFAAPPPPTGNYSVKNGLIIAPNGSTFLARGINMAITEIGAALTSSAGGPLTTIFPGINYVRVACYSYQPPSYFQQFITWANGLGIIVELENHQNFNANGSSAGNNGGGSGVIFTGSLLATESAWYTSIAQAFASNPMVWFGTNNEPPGGPAQSGGQMGALSLWHQATYNAIRVAGGNNNMILIDTWGAGVMGSIGAVPNGNTPAVYAPMTNVVWDFHLYAGFFDGENTSLLISQATLQSEMLTWIAQFQTITSKDGIMPVLSAECGNSTTGNPIDASGPNTVAAVIANVQPISGYLAGAAFWEWNSGGAPGDELANGGAGITSPYGTTVAAFIAA